MTEAGEGSPFERTITVALDSAALETGKARAARRLAQELKIKGFRPGKAPRKVVESMVGADTMRREAIDEALPDAVQAALAEAGLEPAITPRGVARRDA